jgi:hypothetical protein
MQELMKGNERGTKVLAIFKDLLRDEERILQSIALGVLIRNDDALGPNLPISGAVGDKRVSIIKEMDEWIDAWLWRDYIFHEYRLQKMRAEGFTELCQWEALFEYLKDLDNDLLDRNGRRIGRCVEKTWIFDMTEPELLRRYRCDSWPPWWSQTDEYLIIYWEMCRGGYGKELVGEQRVLNGICDVLMSGGSVPPFIFKIIEDAARRARVRRFHEYETWYHLSRLLFCLWIWNLDIENNPDVPMISWNLTLDVLLMRDDGFAEYRKELCARVLSRILDMRPEMRNLLSGNERGFMTVQLLKEMLKSGKRNWQAASLMALLRIDEESIGSNLPCSGKVGDERVSVLGLMGFWIWRWKCGKQFVYEDRLRKMKASGWVSLSDIEQWESFGVCLKKLESD